MNNNLVKEFLMIDSRVNDDADYEWLYNQGIHNTLRPYWDWAEDANVHVTFEVIYPGTGIDERTMRVVAKFQNDVDRKDFIANHTWDLPKTRLFVEKVEEACFISDK